MADTPEILQLITDEIGPVAAERLARCFGGRQVYLPKSVSPTHPLAEALGLGDATKLVQLFGAGRLLVPLGESAGHRRTRRAIADMLRDSQSHNVIARRLKVHVRTVERTARDLRLNGDPRQASLFESKPTDTKRTNSEPH